MRFIKFLLAFSETKDFVETLFLCLKNKTYLPPSGPDSKSLPKPAEDRTEGGRDPPKKDNGSTDGASKRMTEDGSKSKVCV